MIKIIILSDTHGGGAEIAGLSSIINESDYLIHAGDGFNDINLIRSKRPDTCFQVRGNCDYSTAPDEIVTSICGKKFFITHGHKYSVKSGLNKLKFAAYEKEADITVFGHTHLPLIEKEGGITFINPGSLRRFYSKPSYCYLLIENGKIFPKIIELT